MLFPLLSPPQGKSPQITVAAFITARWAVVSRGSVVVGPALAPAPGPYGSSVSAPASQKVLVKALKS